MPPHLDSGDPSVRAEIAVGVSAECDDAIATSGLIDRKALLIIITFNSREALPDIVCTIREFEEDHVGNHVIVVENSSDTHIRDVIESALNSDRILVSISQSNEGFSCGVNFAYRQAQELWGDFDLVVLLNPDVRSAGRTVCELVNRASAQSEAGTGIWSPVLKDEFGQLDNGCARRVWNRRRFFSHLVGYPNLTRALLCAPRRLTEREIAYDQSELAMVSGAFVCIKADVLGHGLDTLLPMYLEDQEICLRCLSRGYSVRLYPDLQAVHIGGASRKSMSGDEHALRIMELIEAPVQCMVRLQGYKVMELRLVVLMGGVARLLAVPLVAAVNTLRGSNIRGEFAWMGKQLRLASWFALWAIKGKLHSTDVSLADYFEEYRHIA